MRCCHRTSVLIGAVHVSAGAEQLFEQGQVGLLVHDGDVQRRGP
jgi:hypothetical protein